jgi:hypothetical protein
MTRPFFFAQHVFLDLSRQGFRQLNGDVNVTGCWGVSAVYETEPMSASKDESPWPTGKSATGRVDYW